MLTIIKCVLTNVFHFMVYSGHFYMSINIIAVYRLYQNFYFSSSLDCSWLLLVIVGVVNNANLYQGAAEPSVKAHTLQLAREGGDPASSRAGCVSLGK